MNNKCTCGAASIGMDSHSDWCDTTRIDIHEYWCGSSNTLLFKYWLDQFVKNTLKEITFWEALSKPGPTRTGSYIKWITYDKNKK